MSFNVTDLSRTLVSALKEKILYMYIYIFNILINCQLISKLYSRVVMSSTPSIHVPGLDIKINLGVPDKLQYFRHITGSHIRCLESGIHTDMVLTCPQEKVFIRVSFVCFVFVIL